MTLEEFLSYYSLNASQITWMLGAGASRSAGMPSASDIIWDLKRRYYCLKEDRYIADNDLSNEAVKSKIQTYLEGIGCPQMWADEEYSKYFELLFNNDLEVQRNYLSNQLDPQKISINSGHRILASLLALGLAKMVFTTNFDTVLENAFALIAAKELNTFSLEGSVGAIDALNDEKFPIYAKMHGDFRFTSMKNLPEDLKNNDLQIEKCFVAAGSRYGMIVSGYSGRDTNVMHAFEQVLQTNNPFPKGLFWITSTQGRVSSSVEKLIENAKQRGINAHIICGDTFDTFLGKIWKVVGKDHKTYDEKIRRLLYQTPKIPKYSGRGAFPQIHLNAFPIIQMPLECLNIIPKVALTSVDFKEKLLNSKSAAIATKGKTILAWGTKEDIFKVISEDEIKSSKKINLENYLKDFKTNTQLSSFYTRALARSLVLNKPLKLRKIRDKFFVVLHTKDEGFAQFDNIFKDALKTRDFNANTSIPAKQLAGKVPGVENTFWMECIEISLEYVDNNFLLVIEPKIWIEPHENRKLAREFIKDKVKARYNTTQNSLLEAWSTILFGRAAEAEVTGGIVVGAIGFSFVTNASKLPPNVLLNAKTVGKLILNVRPVT